MTKAIIITGIVLGAAAASAAHLFNVAGRGAGEASSELVAVSSDEPGGNDMGESDVVPLSTKTFNGTYNADCIKFGRVWQGEVGDTDQGIGICIYTYVNFECGDYVSRQYTGPDDWELYDTYTVLGYGSGDLIRFAGDRDGEPCGAGWTIDNDMPDANNGLGFTQKFYGGVGNDAIFPCYTGNSSVCWKYATKEAYGDTGTDILQGGYYRDIMYGGDGIDDLFGWSGDDELHGGAGDDCIYGDDGTDTLYGDDGVDWLHGGDGTDTCYCSDGQGTRYSCNGTPDYCDGSASECFIK